MRAQRFDADDVATIKRLAEKGFPAVVIAKALSGDRTAEAVRKKCVQVGISLRPDKLHHEVRAAVDSHVWAHLHRHALRRGVTVARLTRTIVTVLAIDGLIDALLDDKPR